MIAALAKMIEWACVQRCFRRMPHPDGQDLRLEEAIQFLNGSDFMPPESQPAEVVFDKRSAFHFGMPRPGLFAENNLVYGHLYRCSERWRERPTIILLPGRNDSTNYRITFPGIALCCRRIEWNAATLVLPYHFQRRPQELKGWSGSDYLQIAKTAAQGIAEIRALMGWLLKEGCPAVALWGVSMGGHYAGWVASCDARLTAAVLAVPGVGVNDSITERIVWRQVREAMRKQRPAFERLNLTPVNLSLLQPAIPRKNILLIEAIHDLLAPKEDIERLWQAWGQPDIWRLPHGHVSWMLTPGVYTRTFEWLASRLESPAISAGFRAVQVIAPAETHS